LVGSTANHGCQCRDRASSSAKLSPVPRAYALLAPPRSGSISMRRPPPRSTADHVHTWAHQAHAFIHGPSGSQRARPPAPRYWHLRRHSAARPAGPPRARDRRTTGAGACGPDDGDRRGEMRDIPALPCVTVFVPGTPAGARPSICSSLFLYTVLDRSPG
jgi:hypothetical protein